jgi:hypothetical protein
MLGQEVLDAWNWRREWSFAEKLDVLFYANQDFRLGQFSAPNMLDLGSRAFMVYPLLDERVARLAAGLSVFDRVSERVLFGAIRQLQPQLANMPLHGEMWHFDRFPERTDFIDSNHNFQAGFDRRRPRACDALRGPAIHGDQGNGVAKRTIAEFLMQTSLRRELEDCILPEVSAEIAARATGSPASDWVNVMDKWTKFYFEAFLKRAFVGASLYDLGW